VTTLLVADVGGTNARFAVYRDDAPPGPPVVLASADHDGIEAAIRAALDRLGATETPSEAAIAVAGPVLGDRVAMTNHPWRFSRRALAEAFGFERLIVINDFAAIAHALPHLPEDAREAIGGGRAVAGAPLVALGPGTGLGVSALVPGASGDRAVAGEGGHVDFAPGDAREDAVLARLRARFGHVSLERLLSGAGLRNLHRALAEIAGEAAPETPAARQITALAAAGACPRSVAATRLFSAVLGAAAGNLALTLGARGGVFVAGGIVPAMGTAFDRARFRARFEDKGRFHDYLAAIPTYLIRAEQPALIGLAARLAAPPSREAESA